MRRLLLLALLLPLAAAGQAAPPDSVLDAAEVMPQIVGGPAALAAAVAYPEAALREGVEGTVVVQFVVDAAGVPSRAEVVRTPSPLLAEAARAAVDSVRFVPGTVGGAPVSVRMAVPIRFTLPAPPPRAAPVLPPSPLARRALEEIPPELIGGLAGLQQHVVYPVEARRNGIQGTVVVQFVVTEQGTVEAPVVLRSVHPLLDAAAVEAVRASQFRPGSQEGRPVRVRFSIPIAFRLR